MNRIQLCMLRLVAVLAVSMTLLDGAQAQTPPAQTPRNETEPQVESLEKLVSTLENDETRSRLVDQIRALIAVERRSTEAQPPTVGSRYVGAVADGLQELRTGALDLLAGIGNLSATRRWWSLQVEDVQGRQRWIGLLVGFVAVGVGGAATFASAWFLLAKWRRTIAAWQPAGALARTAHAAGFLLLQLLPVAAFAAGALSVVPFLDLDLRLRLVLVAAINAVVVGQAVLLPARAALAPDAPRLWQADLPEKAAREAYVWLRRLTILALAGYIIVQIADLLQIPPNGRRLLVSLVGLATAALVVAFVLQARTVVAAWLRGETGVGRIGAVRRRFAEVWHVAALAATLAIFTIWLFKEAIPVEIVVVSGLKTVFTLIVAGVAMAGTRNLLRRATDSDGIASQLSTGVLGRARRYVIPIGLLLRLAIAVIAAVVIFEQWGFGAVEWLGSPVGRRFSSAAFGLAIIAALSVVAWEATNAAVERLFARAESGPQAVARDRRLRTLQPLVRTTANITLAAIIVMVVLAELGVNIGPLIAGAGVVGIAVGFGAQKLVQDVITGVFILMEDTIAVGDVVDVGSHSGVVEALTMRSVRLRDLAGSVHTVPFSAVSSVINMTKDFSHFVLDVGVSYREDTDQVVEVLKEIDAEMRAEPEFAQRMIAPIEILGVDGFAESAVIVKARLKTQPIQQWTVGREFNRRMKKRFDALGIEIPFPHTTVFFGSDKQGIVPPVHLQLSRVAPAAGG